MGLLDNSFGSGGMLISGGETSAVVFSLSVQPDMGIVAGECNSDYYSVLRYNSDGSLDTGFTINLYFYSFSEFAAVLQGDGKIVVGGSGIWPQANFIIARYNSNGNVDSTFNSIGSVMTVLGEWSHVFSLAIQPDGKIVAGGYTQTGLNKELVLARYDTGGGLDSSFHQTGITKLAIDSVFGFNSLTLQPDGKILVMSPGNYYFNPILVRCNTDGSFDTTFGANGIVDMDFFRLSSSFALQANGKILVTGTTDDADFKLICLNTDGTIDSGFGTSGMTITDFDGHDDAATCIAIQPDRKIVVAGFSSDFIALARYLSELNVGIVNFSSLQSSPLIYPNPIHQTETLEYTLTKNESLTISLYDLNEKLIRNFISNEPRAAGEHKETLDIGDLTSGSYFLIISNASQKISVKMVKQ